MTSKSSQKTNSQNSTQNATENHLKSSTRFDDEIASGNADENRIPVENFKDTISGDVPQSGEWCGNCGARLEASKCKLFCRTPGCGFLVTCAEW